MFNIIKTLVAEKVVSSPQMLRNVELENTLIVNTWTKFNEIENTGTEVEL